MGLPIVFVDFETDVKSFSCHKVGHFGWPIQSNLGLNRQIHRPLLVQLLPYWLRKLYYSKLLLCVALKTQRETYKLFCFLVNFESLASGRIIELPNLFQAHFSSTTITSKLKFLECLLGRTSFVSNLLQERLFKRHPRRLWSHRDARWRRLLCETCFKTKIVVWTSPLRWATPPRTSTPSHRLICPPGMMQRPRHPAASPTLTGLAPRTLTVPSALAN